MHHKEESLKDTPIMLPRTISGHPYFHEGINEEQAKEIVSSTPENKGNFLFCKSNDENPYEYVLMCKGLINNELMIKAIKCTFIAERFGSKVAYGGFEHVFSGLKRITRLVEEFKNPFRRKSQPDFIFIPRPIYNPTCINNRLRFKDHNPPLPLPGDIARMLFQKLDIPSLISTNRVSRSWYTFFNENFLTTIMIAKEKVIQLKIKEDEARHEHLNTRYLMKRHPRSRLE